MSSNVNEVKTIASNIDDPLWDLSTFSGRLRHFFWVTDYRSVVVPQRKLEDAKDLVTQCRYTNN